MTSEQQWEYCQLMLNDSTVKNGRWYYDVTISYFGESGVKYRNISNIEGMDARPWPYNPYDCACSLLGTAGWELVSVEHSEITGEIANASRPDHVVAYFQRPRAKDRDVDEPKLVFPQNPYA